MSFAGVAGVVMDSVDGLGVMRYLPWLFTVIV